MCCRDVKRFNIQEQIQARPPLLARQPRQSSVWIDNDGMSDRCQQEAIVEGVSVGCGFAQIESVCACHFVRTNVPSQARIREGRPSRPLSVPAYRPAWSQRRNPNRADPSGVRSGVAVLPTRCRDNLQRRDVFLLDAWPDLRFGELVAGDRRTQPFPRAGSSQRRRSGFCWMGRRGWGMRTAQDRNARTALGGVCLPVCSAKRMNSLSALVPGSSVPSRSNIAAFTVLANPATGRETFCETERLDYPILPGCPSLYTSTTVNQAIA